MLYFGPTRAGPFHSCGQCFTACSVLDKYQSGDISWAPLKPDAVLHLPKPQKHLAKGRHKNLQSPQKCIVDTGESPHSLTVCQSNIEATDQEQSFSQHFPIDMNEMTWKHVIVALCVIVLELCWGGLFFNKNKICFFKFF